MHETTLLYMPDNDGNYIKVFEATVLRAGEDFVVLDRSVFYPLGGGQPSDTGSLEWGDGKAAVVEVKKKGEIVHHLQGPVPPEGTAVRGSLDWEKRYGHMRMHTAQHLVSAVVYDLYKATTVGNQIHPERSRIDFHPADLSQDDLARIEEESNALIGKGLPVLIYERDRDEVLAVGEKLRVNLDILPKSVRRLRVIEIKDFDICPCAGTHVRSLTELGTVRIKKRESKGKGRVRVTYTLE